MTVLPTTTEISTSTALERVRVEIESLAMGDEASAPDRARQLGDLADELRALIGAARSAEASVQLMREAGALSRDAGDAVALAASYVRDDLIADGEDPADLTEQGFVSAEQLEEMRRDGTLELLGSEWVERLHPRGRGGQFRSKFGASIVPSRAASPPGDYESRKERLQGRAWKEARSPGSGKKAKKGAQTELPVPQTPGTTRPAKKDTGPTPDPQAKPNPSGKTSQKRLLALIAAAVSQPTTVDCYSRTQPDGTRVYDESRRALHEEIISRMLDHIPSQTDPRVFFSGGGYAAGKGSVTDASPNMLEGEAGVDFLKIDPDEIKAQLPEFDELLEVDPEANLLCYEEAWDIAQELQRRAVQKKVHVFVDGIADTSPEDMAARVSLFTKNGYSKPVVTYVDIPTEEAIHRANLRAKKAKKRSDRRFIPEVIMRSVHRDVASTIPGVIDLAAALGLRVEVWNNNQGWNEAEGKPVPPVPVFTFDPDTGEKKIEDDGLWKELLAKGSETIEGVD